MHGQKKRRKRSLEGLIEVNGIRLVWELLSEPKWTSEHGYKGLCISVRSEDCAHRELILEYPVPNKRTGIGAIQLPQRPKFSEKTVLHGIRQAIETGWSPESRGKAIVLKVS